MLPDVEAPRAPSPTPRARATAARCCLGAALGGAALLAVGVGRGADPRRRLFETHAAAWVEALVAFLMLVTLTVLAVVVRKFAALGEDEGSGGARARQLGEQLLSTDAKRNFGAAEAAPPSDRDVAPLKESARAAPPVVIASALLYFAFAVGLVYLNNYILNELFPYSAMLSTCQMAFCSFASAFCVFVLRLRPRTPGMTPRVYLTRVTPLGILFAFYLYGTATPYETLSVSFIQLVKPITGPLTFVLLVALGMEQYSPLKLGVLFVIFGAVSIEGLGEAELGAFNTTGFSWLVVGCASSAAYLVLSQRLMQGGDVNIKLNPITQMLYVGPLAALACLAISYAQGEDLGVWNSSDNKMPWWILLADVALAFGFNVSTMNFISQTSALQYAIASYVKDAFIVFGSVIFLGDAIDLVQCEGTAMMFIGSALWAALKLYKFGEEEAATGALRTVL